jgi:small subunit ribosomal protein S17
MARKERVGTVVSDKMDKTVVVAVENRFPHPIYQKTVRRTTRYKAHDETNSCKVGDRVRITETRPLSRSKRWAVAEVIVHGSTPAAKAAPAAVPAPADTSQESQP